MTNDNPTRMVGVAHRMAEFGNVRGERSHPWWALAAGVEGLTKLAAEEGPLQEPATVAVQIMAAIFNERVGD